VCSHLKISSSFLYRNVILPQSLHPQERRLRLLECVWHCSLFLTPTSSPGLPPTAEETFASSWCRFISNVISSASRHHHSRSSGRLRLEIGNGITKSDKSRRKKDSSKEEQLQKMGKLINRKDNWLGEILVEEKWAAVTRAASHQQKGCHIKHLTLSVAQAALQAHMGALGSLTAFLLHTRVTDTLKDFVVVWLTPWIRAECPTKPWLSFGENSPLGLPWKESVCTAAALQLD